MLYKVLSDQCRSIHRGICRWARLLRKVDTWNKRTARLFAADCAEHVLPIFEQRHPGDDRPRKAIEAARRYANSQSAAWDAAADAAGDAAADAAGDAAADAAGDAAADAAGDAAGDAAAAAARDAARAAARAAAMDCWGS